MAGTKRLTAGQGPVVGAACNELYFRERGELPRVNAGSRIVARDLESHQQRVLFDAARIGGLRYRGTAAGLPPSSPMRGPKSGPWCWWIVPATARSGLC